MGSRWALWGDQCGCLGHESAANPPCPPLPAVINALSQRYFLQASDQKDLQDWVEALNRASKITVGYLMLFSVVPPTLPRDPLWSGFTCGSSFSLPAQLWGTAAVLQGGPAGAFHIPSCSRPSSSSSSCWDLAQPAPHCGHQRVALLCFSNLFIPFLFFLECPALRGPARQAVPASRGAHLPSPLVCRVLTEP